MRDPPVIHVVRHGRTRSNRIGLVMGWSEESIEPDQHDAADAVAARLAAASAPVRVVSSPLARALDTAAPLAAALAVDLETDARVGELHQGPWEGLAESEVARRWPLEWSAWRTAPRCSISTGERRSQRSLCPGGRRLRRSCTFLRCRDSGRIHPRRSGAGGPGVDAARRSGHVPAH
jgi:broad specificity phosphatase PhoE